MQSVQSAGKHLAGTKRRKTDDHCQARENRQSVTKVGKVRIGFVLVFFVVVYIIIIIIILRESPDLPDPRLFLADGLLCALFVFSLKI